MAFGSTNSVFMTDLLLRGGRAVVGNSYSDRAGDSGIEILAIKGKSVQESTQGYNLIGLPDVKKTTNGSITYSITDGILSLNGTWDGTGILSVADILGQVAEAGTYVLKVIPIGGSWTAGSIGIRQVVGGEQTMYQQQSYGYSSATKTYEAAEINADEPLKLYVTNGAVFSNFKCHLLLTKGSDTTMEYEPYSGAVASPNPDYPQEIHSFGETMNIQSGTGQLLDCAQLPTSTKEGATVTNNGDGSFTITGSGTPTNTLIASYIVKDKSLFRAGKIRLLCGAQTNPYCNVFIASSGGSIQVTNLYSASETKELTEEILNGDNFYMTVSFSCASSNFINGTIKPVLYQDGNEEWRPFNHETIPVDVPLRSLPNGVCDTYENGKIVRRVGVEIFDGSEEWATWVLTNGNRRFNAPMPNAGAKHLPLISHFKSEFSNEYNYGFIGDSKDICLQYNISSVEAFKEWLADNPMTVLYELEAPVIEEVTLPLIPSWYDWTNVWHDSVETEITWLVKNGGLARIYEEMKQLRSDLDAALTTLQEIRG